MLGNWDYGKILRDADISKKLSDIKEIDHYEISFTTNILEATNMIVPKFNEIIRPETIMLNFQYENLQ